MLPRFLPRLEEALSGGKVKAFQLRLKDAEDGQILEAAKEILPLCRRHDIAFILNDRPDLVKATLKRRFRGRYAARSEASRRR